MVYTENLRTQVRIDIDSIPPACTYAFGSMRTHTERVLQHLGASH